MYQRKGEKPQKVFPNFKMLITVSKTAMKIIKELLEDVGLVYEPTLDGALYLVHRDGKIGEGKDISSFLQAAYSEMTLTELSTWKIVPLPLTLSEVEAMIGHKIKIIEEEE